jgi:hypothetical protein
MKAQDMRERTNRKSEKPKPRLMSLPSEPSLPPMRTLLEKK